MAIDPFRFALEKMNDSSDSPSQLSLPFLDLIPADGAAVSTVGNFLGNETISASSAQAGRIDELQFDLGEGPCWDAMRSSRPVLRPDLESDAGGSWPAFIEAVLDENIRSIFAFPLLVGSLQIGAVDLYSRKPLTITHDQTRDAAALASVAGRHVLRHVIGSANGNADEASGAERGFPRRVVHQATGMVMAQMGLTAEDATLVIQSHAFASSRSMMDVARDIVGRTLALPGLGEHGVES